jgi:hypothetical protein
MKSANTSTEPNLGRELFMRNLHKVLLRRGYTGDALEARIKELLARDFPRLTAVITTRKNPKVIETGMRGLLTGDDLYVWHGLNHTDYERQSGVSGIRLILRSERILINLETVDQPEHFPWVFPQHDQIVEMDMNDRRAMVEQWLTANEHLQQVYPDGFRMSWYC